MQHIDRRRFLLGTGGAVIALPMVEELLPKAFAQGSAPKRLFTLYFGNGLPAEYTASGFSSRAMAPLAKHAGKIALVRGIECAGGKSQEGHEHDKGSTGFARLGGPGSASLDQAAYTHYKPGTLRDVLVAGISNYTAAGRAIHSFDANGRGRAAERVPYNIFSYLFDPLGSLPSAPQEEPAPLDNSASAALDAAEAAALREHRYRTSILDGAIDGYTSLVGGGSPYGPVTKAVLQNHLDELRELERRVISLHEQRLAQVAAQRAALGNGGGTATAPADTSACSKPDASFYGQAKYRQAPTMVCTGACDDAEGYQTSSADWNEVWPLIVDLTVMALKCDIVRFGHLQNTAGGDRFTILNMGDATHEYGHNWGPDRENGFDRAVEWLMQKNALLLDKLDAVVEANGKTMLDNTLIYMGTELSDPSDHSLDRLSFILAGGSYGLKHGQYQFNNSVSDVELSARVLEAAGAQGSIGSGLRKGNASTILA